MKKHFDVILIVILLALAFFFAPSKEKFQQRDLSAALVAAEKGDVKSQSYLAECYYFGIGVQPSGKDFLKWAYKAARQNDGWAEVMLAWFYQNTLHRTEESVKWARKSAATGHPRGQRYMGYISHYGIGVPQDDVEAVKWWRLAAAQDDDGAEENLGDAYANGSGVPHDDAIAAQWYGLAGAHGDPLVKARSVYYFFKVIGSDIENTKAPKSR